MVELLVVILIVVIILWTLMQIIKEIWMYKYRAVNNYKDNITNVIFQNVVNKIDIRDFIYGWLTYFPKGGVNANVHNTMDDTIGDVHRTTEWNIKPDLLYFVNRKYVENNDNFLQKIKEIVDWLKIDTYLPFFVFSTSNQTIGLFWFEKYEDIADPSDDIYNVNLYYLDKNFYSKTHWQDKLINLNNAININDLINDLNNHKTTLIKDIYVIKNNNEDINTTYERVDSLNNKIKIGYDSPLIKYIRAKDIIIYIEGWNHIRFSKTIPTNWSISEDLSPEYPIIQRFYETQQHTKYYLVWSLLYHYLATDHSLGFNKIINPKTYRY